MSDVIHIIRAKTVNKLRKEAHAEKKSKKIPHHEALDQAARSCDFNNWEHLQKSASMTAISEDPYRNGYVIAMDTKDAYDHPLSKNCQFVPDENIFAFVLMDFMEQRGYKKIEDLSEDEHYFLEDLEVNYVYFRFAGQTPKTIEKAFAIAEDEFFFAPGYIWLNGKWYDHYGLFDYDKSLNELHEQMENDGF